METTRLNKYQDLFLYLAKWRTIWMMMMKVAESDQPSTSIQHLSRTLMMFWMGNYEHSEENALNTNEQYLYYILHFVRNFVSNIKKTM